MACISNDCTLVIKSVEPHDIDDILRSIRKTRGFSWELVKDDQKPELPGGKIMFCNYDCSANAEVALLEMKTKCAEKGWANGRTRAVMKHQAFGETKLLDEKPKAKAQRFPVHITGFTLDDVSIVKQELQDLFSAYGGCWVKVDFAIDHPYALIYFDEFASALKVVQEPHGIRYSNLVLKPSAAFDTKWANHVLNELKNTEKLSFSDIEIMAQAGVGNAKKFFPQDPICILERTHHFAVNNKKQEVTLAASVAPLLSTAERHHREAACSPQLSETSTSPQASQDTDELSAAASSPGEAACYLTMYNEQQNAPPSEPDSEDAHTTSPKNASDDFNSAGNVLAPRVPPSGITDTGSPQSCWTARCPRLVPLSAPLESSATMAMGCEPTECGTPSKFVCPISQQLMRDPVRLSNGTAYERSVIQQYLTESQKSICPLTQVPIDPTYVTADPKLKKEIAEYQRTWSLASQQPGTGSRRQLLLPGHSDPADNASTDSLVGERSWLGDARAQRVHVRDFQGSSESRTYVLDECLGGGGMGRVYRATKQLGPRAAERREAPMEQGPYAVKVCSAGQAGAGRGGREAEILHSLQRVRHENVVQLFDRGLSQHGHVVLVMEVIEPGWTLRELLGHGPGLGDPPALNLLSSSIVSVDGGGKRLPWPLCHDLVGQILSGMAAVHQAGVAHRDLKPSNVMLQHKDGRLRVVIIDFGISKSVCSSMDDDTITMTGQTLGTPSYMSPEQTRGVAATPELAMAADVWALGVLLHMMVEGRHPFAVGCSAPPRTEAEKATLIDNIQKLPLPPLLHAPPGAQQVIRAALQKQVSLRLSSAATMQDAFLQAGAEGQLPLEGSAPQPDGGLRSSPDLIAGQRVRVEAAAHQPKASPEGAPAALPEGLEEVAQLLARASLGGSVEAAGAWFEEKGLESLEDLRYAEMEGDLVSFLQLKEGRARILLRMLREHGGAQGSARAAA